MQNTKSKQTEVTFSQQDVTNPSDTKVHIRNEPDERNGIYISGHIKIFDPNTKEEFVNKREGG